MGSPMLIRGAFDTIVEKHRRYFASKTYSRAPKETEKGRVELKFEIPVVESTSKENGHGKRTLGRNEIRQPLVKTEEMRDPRGDETTTLIPTVVLSSDGGVPKRQSARRSERGKQQRQIDCRHGADSDGFLRPSEPQASIAATSSRRGSAAALSPPHEAGAAASLTPQPPSLSTDNSKAMTQRAPAAAPSIPSSAEIMTQRAPSASTVTAEAVTQRAPSASTDSSKPMTHRAPAVAVLAIGLSMIPVPPSTPAPDYDSQSFSGISFDTSSYLDQQKQEQKTSLHALATPTSITCKVAMLSSVPDSPSAILRNKLAASTNVGSPVINEGKREDSFPPRRLDLTPEISVERMRDEKKGSDKGKGTVAKDIADKRSEKGDDFGASEKRNEERVESEDGNGEEVQPEKSKQIRRKTSSDDDDFLPDLDDENDGFCPMIEDDEREREIEITEDTENYGYDLAKTSGIKVPSVVDLTAVTKLVFEDDSTGAIEASTSSLSTEPAELSSSTEPAALSTTEASSSTEVPLTISAIHAPPSLTMPVPPSPTMPAPPSPTMPAPPSLPLPTAPSPAMPAVLFKRRRIRVSKHQEQRKIDLKLENAPSVEASPNNDAINFDSLTGEKRPFSALESPELDEEPEEFVSPKKMRVPWKTTLKTTLKTQSLVAKGTRFSSFSTSKPRQFPATLASVFSQFSESSNSEEASSASSTLSSSSSSSATQPSSSSSSTPSYTSAAAPWEEVVNGIESLFHATTPTSYPPVPLLRNLAATLANLDVCASMSAKKTEEETCSDLTLAPIRTDPGLMPVVEYGVKYFQQFTRLYPAGSNLSMKLGVGGVENGVECRGTKGEGDGLVCDRNRGCPSQIYSFLIPGFAGFRYESKNHEFRSASKLKAEKQTSLLAWLMPKKVRLGMIKECLHVQTFSICQSTLPVIKYYIRNTKSLKQIDRSIDRSINN